MSLEKLCASKKAFLTLSSIITASMGFYVGYHYQQTKEIEYRVIISLAPLALFTYIVYTTPMRRP